MKAKVIRETYRLANLSVGEVVEIIPGMETDAEGIWNIPAGKLVLCKKGDGTYTYSSLLDMEVIDESSSVDWAAFRREAAKDVLPAVIAKKSSMCGYDEVVREAVLFAEELIKQLRGGKE